jgi:1,2-phenylacetyl-CoA epoxidase PaaB subunit
MSSEQTTSETEVVEQPAKPKMFKKKKKKKLKIIDENQSQDGEIDVDKYHKWSDKSKDVPFETSQQCVGNGEEKLAKELDILTPLGGQNSTVDLVHPIMGNISVKDMTKDDCTLGTECCNDMRKIFRTIINLFVCWIIKYKSECELANKFYNEINKKYGSSKITIIDGIDRLELSKTNLQKLNELLNELKHHKSKNEYDSLKSEYIHDILVSLNDSSLQDMLNECVRKEATIMTLIIVNKKKGWLIVKDIDKLSCPRITRGAPRINYS